MEWIKIEKPEIIAREFSNAYYFFTNDDFLISLSETFYREDVHKSVLLNLETRDPDPWEKAIGEIHVCLLVKKHKEISGWDGVEVCLDGGKKLITFGAPKYIRATHVMLIDRINVP